MVSKANIVKDKNFVGVKDLTVNQVEYYHNQSLHQYSNVKLSNQSRVTVNSSTRLSSWMNDLFGWVKSSIGGLLSSKPESTASSVSQVDTQFASVSNGSSNRSLDTEEITKHKLKCRKDIPNSTSTTSSNSTGQKQGSKHAHNYFTNGGFFRDNVDYVNVNLSQARERQMYQDFNGTIMLLDILIRKLKTGEKHVLTQVKGISEQEALNYAFSITQECEKIVEQAALKSGISMHRLNIDYMEMQKEITKKVMSGKFDEISGILISYVEKACPGRGAGKLSPKKFDKFMIKFNKELDVTLNQSIQQILNTRNSTLEVNDVKEQQISLEPQSYLSNASVHSHSKVSTCLSEIGVTKLVNNLSR